MSNKTCKILCLAIGMAAVATLAGCTNYIKRTDFNAAIEKLQATDQNLQQQITSLTQDMHTQFSKYDAQITAMQGRIRVDTVAHFAFNEATLQDQDKAMLDDFAKVMRDHHSTALVTVEGFTDPAGSAAYNQKLGQARADAVRDYLVTTGGMPAARVRPVSYGEVRNRLVQPGASHDEGANNRRVSLVIDFADAMASAGNAGGMPAGSM